MSDDRAERAGSELAIADPERWETVGNRGRDGAVRASEECPEAVRRDLLMARFSLVCL